MALLADTGPLLPDTDPLLTLAIVLVVGFLGGRVAKLVRLPGITGQILVGVVMGHSILNVFDAHAVEGLQPLTHFALGLMAATTGAHLNLKRMRNAGKRLFLLFVAEATITPLLVFGGLLALGHLAVPELTFGPSLMLAAIAVSTAPATVVAIVNETRSKGVFVKTLIAAVALNNMTCIFLFEIARAIAVARMGPVEGDALATGIRDAGMQLLQAGVIGAVGAATMEIVLRIVPTHDRLAPAAIAIILLTSGCAEYLEVSPLLACLFLGIVQTNLRPKREQLVDRHLVDFEHAILAIFFTLAGLHLSFDNFAQAGLAAGAFFVLRAIGKLLAVDWSMRLAGTTEKVRKYLGAALLPQAGLAIGLVILVQDDPRFADHQELLKLFVGVVLTAVTINEVIGPVLTRHSLKRAGEVGQDRSRLIDFIQEENITTDLSASDKEGAIGQLVDLLIRSHHLEGVNRDELLRTIFDRESQVSTCVGGGLAVPHGVLPNGDSMLGVMGISQKGMLFDAPDGKPVHCMVLLVTPVEERDRHLQVLAMLARIVTNLETALLLFEAKSPAHAWEILHGDDAEDFNYFLED